LVGSLARPYGGRLSDRVGGSIVTMVSFLVMAAAGYMAVLGVKHKDLALFFISFIVLFISTGIGNGSTYRMIPSIFKRLQLQFGSSTPASAVDFRRQAAGAVGIISAVGAFGGFAIPFVYKWSKETFGNIVPALEIYIGIFLMMAVLTWAFFLRKGARMHGV
jgi:NNP family nitrate/nitrite transporter-like MFS transporter